MQRRVLHGTQVQEEGNYIEGKLDGPVYHYSENGALMKTVTITWAKSLSDRTKLSSNTHLVAVLRLPNCPRVLPRCSSRAFSRLVQFLTEG